jgi:hypothetical protein
VLEARGETAALVRAPWLLERMMAPGREGCGELHHHDDAVLVTMRPPTGGVFGLAVGGLWPGWDPSILRLALRFLSPGALRAPTPAEALVERALQSRRSGTLTCPEPGQAASDLDLRWHTANLERHLLHQALRRSQGNLSEAARLAGISRARLRRRLSALGLR